VVIFSADPAEYGRFWLTRDYLRALLELAPQRYRAPGFWAAEYAELLGGEVTVTPVPVPHDCVDSFYGSYWKRPHAYLDPAVRAATSVFSRVSGDDLRLAADLESGEWERRNAELLDLDELDIGHRLVVAHLR
jgi:hypothetical protein